MAFELHRQPATASAADQLRCSACKVTVSPNERNSHYRSDWHRYNVKRKCVGMEPIERSVFEHKLRSIMASGQKMDEISNKKKKKAFNKRIQQNYCTLVNNEQWQQYNTLTTKTPSSLINYRCSLCSKTFKTHQQCLSHLNTKKHRTEFIKYHKNLRDEQQDEIQAFQATNDEQPPSIDNAVPLDKLKPITTIENNPFITTKKVIIKNKKRGVHDIPNDDESKSNEGEKLVVKQERFPINPSSHCLFCSKDSMESIDSSLSLFCTSSSSTITFSKSKYLRNGLSSF